VAKDGMAVEALLIAAHEADCLRVARELHDDIGQRMAVLTMDLDALTGALALDPEASSRLRAAADMTLALAKDIQALSHRLHPPKLEFLGIASAAAAFCRDVAKRQKVAVAFRHDGIPDGVPAEVALALYRVLQEALANAVKHAGIGQVTVALGGAPEGEVRLEITDAGVGFDRNAVPAGRTLGLAVMQERMRAIGGELIIESRPGAGTSVRARAPLPGADRSPSPIG